MTLRHHDDSNTLIETMLHKKETYDSAKLMAIDPDV